MNNLQAIFVKEEKAVLVVGGKSIAAEKLTTLLRNSPSRKIKLVSLELSTEVRDFVDNHANITFTKKAFSESDLENVQLVFAATRNRALNGLVYQYAKQRSVLCNSADMPEYCDFYLSSVVRKGDLKIAISTNGKSPIIARRLRELFENYLPDELEQVIEELNNLREHLSKDLKSRTKELEKITSVMLSDASS